MRELWVQGVCIWGLSCPRIMSMEGARSVTLWDIRKGRRGGREFSGTNARRCDIGWHGVLFAWRLLGGITTVLHHFIGSEYQ